MTLPLSLTLGSGEQISAFSVDVYFDTAAVQWQSVTLEPSIAALGKQVETNLLAPGHVRMVLYGMDRQLFSGGLLGQCIVQIPASAAAGSTVVSLQTGLSSGPTGAESVLSLSDGRIWIEYPAAGEPFLEAGGEVVIEAEHYHTKISRSSADWVPDTTQAGAGGSGYLAALPNVGLNINTGYATTSPELVYNVNFTTPGTYHVWVRGLGITDSDDSVHLGVDGVAIASADRISAFGTAWTWSQDTMDAVPATIVIPTAGLHTIHVWMREDGFLIDRFMLTTGSSVPSGIGPAESPRGSATPVPPPVIADTTAPVISAVAASAIAQTSATIGWTTDEAATSQVEYGTTTAYGQITPLDSMLNTAHGVNLGGLTAATTYHFRVRSADAAGNQAISSDATFTTLSPPPVATPTISPSGGTFSGSVTVTLATTTSGAEIRYTTNGSTPTVTSTLYTSPFVLSSSATVQARALMAGMTDSAVAGAAFTVNPIVTQPSAITLTAVQTTAASTNWTTSGTERYSWTAPAWLEYRVDFGTGGTWLGAMTAINYKGNLPIAYAFNIDLYVDGGYKGTIKVPGSTILAQTGSRTFTMPSGVHTVRFVWTNDYYQAGRYDANIRVKSVSFTPQ